MDFYNRNCQKIHKLTFTAYLFLLLALLLFNFSDLAKATEKFDIEKYVAKHYKGWGAKYCNNYVRICGNAIDSGCSYLKKSDGSVFSSCGGLRMFSTPEARKAHDAVCPPPDLDCSDTCNSWTSCIGERDIAGTQRFIKNGQDVNAIMNARKGETALHYATKIKNLELVEILLNAGADVNAKDKSGRTPLFLSVRETQPSVEIVRALLNAGAEVETKYRFGNLSLTVLELAVLPNPEVNKKRADLVPLLEEAKKKN